MLRLYARGRIFPTLLGCVLLICAARVPLYAATMRALYQFGENDDVSAPNNIITLPNGSSVVTTFECGDYFGGTVSLVPPKGKTQVLYSFGATEVDNPVALVAGSDGYFYGIYTIYVPTSGGPSAVFYRVGLDHSFAALHTFTTGDGTPTSLIAASDGSFYAAGSNGTSGVIWKMSKIGAVASVTTVGAGITPSALIQASDGAIYGVGGDPGPQYTSDLFSYSSTGGVHLIHRFSTSFVYSATNLVQGNDGFLYLMVSDTVKGEELYRCNTAGTMYNVVCALPGTIGTTIARDSGGDIYCVSRAGQFGNFSLTQVQTNYVPHAVPLSFTAWPSYVAVSSQASGRVSGYDTASARYGLGGDIFQISGTVANIMHSFTGLDGYAGASITNSSNQLVIGPDGSIYGITGAGGGANGYGTLFRLSPSGESTNIAALYDYPSSICLTGYWTVMVGTDSGSLYYGDLLSQQQYPAILGLYNAGTFDLVANPDSTAEYLDAYGSAIYRMDSSGNNMQRQYFFLPMDPVQYPSNLYYATSNAVFGTSQFDASGSHGTVFSIAYNPPQGASAETVLHDFGGDPGYGTAACLARNTQAFSSATRLFGIEGNTNRLFDMSQTTSGPVHYDGTPTKVGGASGALTYSLYAAPSAVSGVPNIWGTLSGIGNDTYGGVFSYPQDGSTPVNLSFPAAAGGDSASLITADGKTFYGINSGGGRYREGSVFVASIADAGYDFNFDGRPDLVWRDTTTGAVSVWDQDDARTLGKQTIAASTDTNWRAVSTADLNGDGWPDILWQNAQTSDVVVWLMKGTQHVASQLIASGISKDLQIVGCADMNGDGSQDIVLRNASTGDVAIWFLDKATLKVASSTFVARGVSLAWSLVGVADINHDGNPDLIWQNPAQGSVAAWLMNGQGAVAATESIASGIDPHWQVVGAADMDGDGDDDLLWRNRQSGDLVVWHMDKSQVLSAGMIARAVPLNLQLAGPR